MRTLVLVDGEHYPPVVRAAIERLPSRIPGCQVVGAAFLGGAEKLRAAGLPDVGVELVGGSDADEALTNALARFAPDLVVDLADQPVVDPRTRMRLAARTIAAGVPYQGADFRFDPPPRPRLATKPSVAVIGTGKRTGKTSVAAELARTLKAHGRRPVVVAMGRGGPEAPELVDPSAFDLTPAGLVALADRGRHAASDHLEDAAVAGVITIGPRRGGGGLAGAPADDNVAAGVALANQQPGDVMVLEGSGSAIPPVHADATICVVPATAEVELVGGYLGPYRLLLADVIVVTMAEDGAGTVLDTVRRLAPETPTAVTVLRPVPLQPVEGRRVFYVTTAPAGAGETLVAHLESVHGATVVGTSHNLARRPQLAQDLERIGRAEVVLVELKAAGVDVVARAALERGLDVVFCDNRVVTNGGDGTFEQLVQQVANLAEKRFGTGIEGAVNERMQR